MEDVYSRNELVVKDKLEQLKDEREKYIEKNQEKEHELNKTQRSLTLLKNELAILENQLYLLAEKKYLKRKIWKKNLLRPFILAFITMIMVAITPLFPESLVVTNFITVLLSVGTGISLVYCGANIFSELKGIKRNTDGITLQDLHAKIKDTEQSIAVKKSRQTTLAGEITLLDGKIKSLEQMIKELERLLEVLGQEREKALNEYLSKLPGLQEYLDQSFQNSQSITPYKRVLQLMGEN